MSPAPAPLRQSRSGHKRQFCHGYRPRPKRADSAPARVGRALGVGLRDDEHVRFRAAARTLKPLPQLLQARTQTAEIYAATLDEREQFFSQLRIRLVGPPLQALNPKP